MKIEANANLEDTSIEIALKKFWLYVSLEILAFMKSSEPVKRVLA